MKNFKINAVILSERGNYKFLVMKKGYSDY